MAEINQIKQINSNGITYDINLPSNVAVDVASVTTSGDLTVKGSATISKSLSANGITNTAIKNAKVLGTSETGALKASTLGISDITDLQTTLNGKAASSHTHTISQVTNLQSSLDSKLNLSGGTLTGIVQGGAIDVHPENGGTVISYYTNDLAFLTQRGGSYNIKNTTSNTVIADSASNNSATNIFDGSPSYFAYTVANLTDTVVILIKSPRAYSYSTTGGIGFGSSNWRAKDIKIEVGYSATNKGTAQSPDSDIVWVTKATITNYAKGLVRNDMRGPNASQGGVAASTWSYIRFTLTNFNTKDPRIAQIYTINYDSKGMHNTFLGLNGGRVYGTINANALQIGGVDVKSVATTGRVGMVKSSTTGMTADRDYKVQVNSDGTMKVNVPWTDTNTHQTVTDQNATLAWGTKSTIATIGSTNINVTMPSNPNTDTHYTTGAYIGATNVKANAATSNGSTYLKVYDNDTKRAEFKIIGSGATTVSSDANGNITINSTDTNTHQSIKSLVTTATTAQAATTEAIAGSGNITLHKVSKTGTYKDLLSRPSVAVNGTTLEISGF